jgi:hypothetical protein
LDRVLLLCLGLASDFDSLTSVSCIAGMTGVHHHAWLICCTGISTTFCLGWPQTAVLLISASWVAGMTDMHHHSWLLSKSFYFANLPLLWSFG